MSYDQKPDFDALAVAYLQLSTDAPTSPEDYLDRFLQAREAMRKHFTETYSSTSAMSIPKIDASWRI